jgi:predicted DNA-binding transcriptional regulator AlpA
VRLARNVLVVRRATMGQMESRRNNLPLSLPPRGLSRVEAAHYVGLGATTFDRAVADGLMPKPFRIYGRVLWCRQTLDAALDVLRDTQAGAEASSASDTWADFQ